MREKFMIIDGNSLMHRAYHALPSLSAGSQPTNAVYGFLSMFFRAVNDETPDYVGVAFDIGKVVFRHTIYQDYKATRKPMDDELRSQFPIVKEVITEMGIPILQQENYEADDIIGSVCNTFRQVDTYVLTGDKDALQLVDEDTFVLLMRKGISDIEKFDVQHFIDVYGIAPAQFVDVKGLMGDNSDNIPGVPKVGEKTALKLIGEFGSMEGVYAQIDQQKGKLKENLITYQEQAFMSRDLAKINCDMPIETPLNEFAFAPEDIKRSYQLLDTLNMKSLISRVDKMQGGAPAAIKKEKFPEIDFCEMEEIKSEQRLTQVLNTAGKHPVALYMQGDQVYFAWQDVSCYFSLPGGLLAAGIDEEAAFEALKPVVEHNPIVSLDSKELMRQLAARGIRLANNYFDISLAAYLIDANEKDYTLPHLAEKYLGQDKINGETLLFLQETLHQKLGTSESLYYNMELPLARVLYEMEEVGFQMDVEVLREIGRDYKQKVIEIEKQIYEMAGEEFNISSPKQLGVVLFEIMGLEAPKKTKTGYSTGAEVLEKVDHPIVPLILEYRKLTKLIGTYIDGFLPLIDRDNRVHTRFLQTGAATGRISSKEPNLQNIPIRTEEGREIRKAFVARPGCLLVTGDYSQIDLRVLAHISGDPVMQDAFNKGQDIHARTASEIFHVPLDQVTKFQRRSAKAVNFGIVYGISPYGLSTNLQIPMAEAKDYIDRYLERYQGVRQYMAEIVEEARSNGFVETLLGRKRYIPQLFNKNRNVAAFGERIALNAPIQGTSADMIKLAMIEVQQKLQSMEAHMILQVHDELLIETPEEEVEQVSQMLQERMSKVLKLDVPVVVDVETGKNWFDAK